MRTVTADFGWLLSTAATLRPALSTAVAKERAMHRTVRGDDALAASMKELFKQMRFGLRVNFGVSLPELSELPSKCTK
jgi:hypothetical protein